MCDIPCTPGLDRCYVSGGYVTVTLTKPDDFVTYFVLDITFIQYHVFGGNYVHLRTDL